VKRSNLHGFIMIDAHARRDSNWRNRATFCVAMRWSIAVTGFKPKLVTPSSQIARNWRYSEFFNAARLRKLHYCHVHSAVIANAIIRNYSSIIYWILQGGIFTCAPNNARNNRVMPINNHIPYTGNHYRKQKIKAMALILHLLHLKQKKKMHSLTRESSQRIIIIIPDV
jgi:hypothetical protein